MATVDCVLLGPLAADVAGEPVELGGPRPRLLFAALLLEVGQVVSTDRLVEAVWGDDAPASARALVAVHVSALRKAFARAGCEHEVVATGRGGYLVPADAVRLDAARAQALLDQARAARAEGRGADAAALLKDAVGLWDGEVLPMRRTPLLDAGAERLAELRLVAVEEWADTELSLGRHADVLAELTAVVAEHPLRERPRAQLMTALLRSGRADDALDVFSDGRRASVEELGLEPGQELLDLRDAILRADGPVDEPVPAELPPAVSAFAGRQAELSALDAVLDGRRRHLPLAVVSGVAGVGKTALVLHWSHRVAARFPGGQLYADLRGYDATAVPVSPGVVLERFLRALGVEGERMPPTVDGRSALFRSTLGDRSVLVVLDNAASAAQVRPLLPGNPDCCVVVTARRRLEGLIAADGAVSVPVDVLDDAEALDLLGRAAGTDRVEADPSSAATLAALCENLPLALRVAAARLSSRPVWTFRDLTTRLTGEHDRLDQLSHDELQVRGSFELSYRDLPQPAATAFRRLGLVDAPAGFAPWLLAAVLDGPLADAEDLCEDLVDAQLLQPLGRDGTGQPRYRFHDLVRLYARERAEWEESPTDREAALLRAYGCLLGLAEELRKEEYGGTSFAGMLGTKAAWLPDSGPVASWLADPIGTFEVERPNLVAAVGHCVELGLHELAWNLVAPYIFLFEVRACYDDWRTIAGQALTACRGAGDVRGEATMLYCLGALDLNQRRLTDAVRPLQRALTLFQQLDDERSGAVVLRHLATVQVFRGDMAGGRRDLERAIASFARIGIPGVEAHALGFLAGVDMLEGRLDDAEREVKRAIAISPQPDQRHGAQLLKRLAEIYWRQGRAADAVAAGERALEIVRVWHDPVGEAYVLHVLGEAHGELGDPATARRLLTQGLEVSRQVGERLIEGRLLLALGRLGTEAAVDHLRAAVRTFDGIDAQWWRDTAAAALREASGETGGDL